jgi:hypothetical protein
MGGAAGLTSEKLLRDVVGGDGRIDAARAVQAGAGQKAAAIARPSAGLTSQGRDGGGWVGPGVRGPQWDGGSRTSRSSRSPG